MNIIYETTKERGTTILMPTSMVDSMNPAAALSLAGQAPPRSRASPDSLERAPATVRLLRRPKSPDHESNFAGDRKRPTSL